MSEHQKVRGVAQASAEKLADAIEKLSHQVLWRNQRASSEVKDAVDIVVTELERMAKTLRSCAPSLQAEPSGNGHLALLAAKDKMTLLDDMVRAALRGAAGSSSFIGEAARLKLALAKLGTADLFEEERKRFQQEARRVQAMTEAILKTLDEQLAEIVAEAALK